MDLMDVDRVDAEFDEDWVSYEKAGNFWLLSFEDLQQELQIQLLCCPACKVHIDRLFLGPWVQNLAKANNNSSIVFICHLYTKDSRESLNK
jgi:hypothetical protein